MIENTTVLLHDAIPHGMAWALMRLAATLGGSNHADDLARAHTTISMLTEALQAGHVCLALADIATQLGCTETLLYETLQRCHLIDLDTPTQRPLRLDSEGRLYFQRYYDYECRLAAQLDARLRQRVMAPPDLTAWLDEAFPPPITTMDSSLQQNHDNVDWQRVAAALALQRPVTVLSGGPGTGKTTTVMKILAGLLTWRPEWRVVMAAPTGKAAARMQEALRGQLAQWPDALRARMPNEAFTLHRLLGVRRSSRHHFYHDREHPLSLDVLIVDEASMLDLALAVKLFEALPPHARVILVGDKDQLAAVEAGAVFSELSASPGLSDAMRARLAACCRLPEEAFATLPTSDGVLDDCTVWLRRNYRFAAQPAIGALAEAVREGDWKHVEDALARYPAPHALDDATRSLRLLHEHYAPYFETVKQCHDPTQILAALERFRVLCALRDTAWGVVALNQVLSDALRRHLAGVATSGGHFHGQPIMVTRNDYLLRLYNGDTGVVLQGDDGEWRAWFPDYRDGGVRAVAVTRLPPHETAFALTVHKAQGSEFEHVALVLPAHDARVITRELLYTGVTRSKSLLGLHGPREVLKLAVQRRTTRHSGLRARF